MSDWLQWEAKFKKNTKAKLIYKSSVLQRKLSDLTRQTRERWLKYTGKLNETQVKHVKMITKGGKGTKAGSVK